MQKSVRLNFCTQKKDLFISTNYYNISAINCQAVFSVVFKYFYPAQKLPAQATYFGKISEKLHIYNEDIKNADKIFGKSSIDYITCNPPYKEAGNGLKNEDDIITIARHEVLCNLEDIILAAEKVLKPGGKIAFVHRPERLADIIWLMRKNKIEPKRLRFVHPYPNKTATMILIEGAKHGGKKLFLEPPLYVYDENRNYTEEIKRIYGRI